MSFIAVNFISCTEVFFAIVQMVVSEIYATGFKINGITLNLSLI